MAFTVGQVSQLSGVSIRTLHWYDEIGLLKPAYCSSGGHRYYEQEQLLRLQQILFFRELGFALEKIQEVLGSDHFDRIRVLQVHRQNLERGIDRSKRLIETIDQTLSYLKGEALMEEEKLYKGFELAKEKSQERYLVSYQGLVAEDVIAEAPRQGKELSAKERTELEKEAKQIYKQIAACIDRACSTRDKEVQQLVRLHAHLIERIHAMSKDVYLSYAQLYVERAEFRQFLEVHHSKLPEFLAEAMRVWAHSEL